MKLEMICNCGCDNCPTIYKDETGNYVVQGYMLTSAHRDVMTFPDGEDAVVIPPEIVDALIKSIQNA